MRPHPDVDLLALHALGEAALGDAERRHVAGCPACDSTVADLARTVRTVRGPVVDEVTPVPVPAHVWQAVAAELDLPASVRPSSVGPSPVGPSAVAPLSVDPSSVGPSAVAPPSVDPSSVDPSAGHPGRTGAGTAGTAGAHGPGLRSVGTGTGTGTPRTHAARSGAREHGSRRPALRLLAVAAAGLVVGAAGTVAVGQLRDGGTGPAGATVLAAADLQEFGAGEGTGVNGSAQLATIPATDDGADEQRVLQVALDRVPDPGEDFLEAWLIDPATGAMVSLGPVPTQEQGATVDLTVPSGLDVATFSLVDVSAEPLDGDPTHSGASLARGSLST